MVLDDDFVFFYDFEDYCHGIVRPFGVPSIDPLIHLGIFVLFFLTNSHDTGPSFLTDLFKDPFLSSVISMVAPTYGAMGANRGKPFLG